MLKIVLPCLLASGLVVGCASSQATSDVVAAAAASASSAPTPPAAAANETFDGIYRGRATPISRGGRCGNFRDPTIRISNNTITRRFGEARLEATVQPDGTFSALAGRTRLSGTVRDGHLDAEASNGSCSYRYNAQPVVIGQMRGEQCRWLADGYALTAAIDLRITSSAASRPAQPVTFTHLPGSRSL